MALTRCPDCEGKVSTEAEACPHCGRPNRPPSPPPKEAVAGSAPSPRPKGVVARSEPEAVPWSFAAKLTWFTLLAVVGLLTCFALQDHHTPVPRPVAEKPTSESDQAVAENQELAKLRADLSENHDETPRALNLTASERRESRGAEQKSGQEVRCETFIVHAQLVDPDRLQIWMETDLPDQTVVMASVGRSYWEKGSTDEYQRTWLSERSTVGGWRSKRIVRIDDATWTRDLEEHQRSMARANLGFDVAKISDEVEVSFVVPINQPDPGFGKGNEHLVGPLVAQDGFRVVRGEEQITRPLASKDSQGSSRYANSRKLKSGMTYRLSADTPIVPAPNPADPLDAIRRTVYAKAGTTVKILSVDTTTDRGTIWYEVVAHDQYGTLVARGWMIEHALLGQDLSILR